MKYFIFLFIIITSIITTSTPLLSSYLIQLKNGGKFVTSTYWEEKGQIKFYLNDGIMSIEKENIQEIKGSEQIIIEKNQSINKNVTIPDNIPLSEQKWFKDKEDLTIKIRDINMYLKDARKNKDKDKIESYMDKLLSLENDIVKLKERVKKENNGELPTWWEGQ
ncbi:MAG: hypothetical protein HQK79_02875 [Desulfobacterales bacterium]|nr:hypothetical protein [Desulfobacterales bacterium]